MSRRRYLKCGVLCALMFGPSSAAAQIVTVNVPAGVSFNVVDVSASTGGSPNSVQVTYSNALLFLPGQSLRISVIADSSTFSGPGAVHIAASSASWTATASSGTPFSGTLSSAGYTQVYSSPNNPSSGSVNLSWTLAPPAAGIRSGTHTLTIRWKFEAL